MIRKNYCNNSNQDSNAQLTAINMNQNQQNRMLQTIFLIEPNFQGGNRLFVLAFNGDNSRVWHSIYFLPTEKIKDYNVLIEGKIFFDQPIKNDLKNIWKHSKNCNWSRRWLHNWLFARLQLFIKRLHLIWVNSRHLMLIQKP